MMLEISLPWPDSKLSPNSRMHWRSKSAAFKLAKEMAFLEAVTLTVTHDPKLDGQPVRLSVYFYPPDKRARDVDNLLASIKAYIDGIAQALNINDAQFNPIIVVRGLPTKHGKVTLSVAR